MQNKPLPLWRSLMFCPANSERFVAKAAERGADAIILDLEDSIALAEKANARTVVRAAAKLIHAGGPDVLVRINRELDMAMLDMDAAVSADVSALVMPKVKGPEHIQLLAEVLTRLEIQRGLLVGHTKLIALVESAEALTKINAIAAADARLVGLAVGGEDLATDLDAEPTADSLYVAKMLGIHAARAAGILPIGVVASVANVTGLDQYQAMLTRSRGLGFAGATCVHPSHVPLINATFSPRPAELERAKKIVDAFEEAERNGLGAILFEGSMIDLPVALRARRTLARAKS